MQEQERDLIAGLFGRLREFENQPRDSEAERLIADFVSRQPAAVYLLTQTAIVQDEALKQARAQIAELESKAKQTQTSFLGSAPRVGPWGAAPSAPQQQAPAPSPWQPAQAAPPAPPQQQGGLPGMFGGGGGAGGGGGFLRTALTTAAGVAGGALLFQGISSMFGHSTSQAFANPAMNPSSLLPPDQFSAADLGPDTASGNNYNSDNYNPVSDNQGFDNSGFADSASDDSSFDDSSYDSSSDDSDNV